MRNLVFERRFPPRALVLGGLGLVVSAWMVWRRTAAPSSVSHLRVGRVWQYDCSPGGETEWMEVLESLPLPGGRQFFRVEYRRGESVIQAEFSSDHKNRLLQLSQSRGAATFDPPLVSVEVLRVGAQWSTSAATILPSKFYASSPMEVSGRVVGWEKVSVPAGTFQAFRIEQVTCGRASTFWHAPGIGMVREMMGDEVVALRQIFEAPATRP